MKDTMDNGITDPGKAMNILQRYQLTCEVAGDQLRICLSSNDYSCVKSLIDSIISATKQFAGVSQKQIDQYSNLLSLKRREIAEKAFEIQAQHPGSFSQFDMNEHMEALEKTKHIKFEEIEAELRQLVTATVFVNEKEYKPLLKMKNKRKK